MEDLQEILGLDQVQDFMNYIIVFLVITYFLTFLSLVYNCFSRFDNKLVAVLFVLIFLPFNFFGIIAYFLLIPERYEDADVQENNDDYKNTNKNYSDLELRSIGMRRCFYCISDIDLNSSFCHNCGNQLKLKCECRSYMKIEWNYCKSCGKSKFEIENKKNNYSESEDEKYKYGYEMPFFTTDYNQKSFIPMIRDLIYDIKLKIWN